MRHEFERSKKAINKTYERAVDTIDEAKSETHEKENSTIKTSKSFINKTATKKNNSKIRHDLSKKSIKLKELRSLIEYENNDEDIYDNVRQDFTSNKKSSQLKQNYQKLSKVLDHITQKPLGTKQIEDTKKHYNSIRTLNNTNIKKYSDSYHTLLNERQEHSLYETDVKNTVINDAKNTATNNSKIKEHIKKVNQNSNRDMNRTVNLPLKKKSNYNNPKTTGPTSIRDIVKASVVVENTRFDEINDLHILTSNKNLSNIDLINPEECNYGQLNEDDKDPFSVLQNQTPVKKNCENNLQKNEKTNSKSKLETKKRKSPESINTPKIEAYFCETDVDHEQKIKTYTDEIEDKDCEILLLKKKIDNKNFELESIKTDLRDKNKLIISQEEKISAIRQFYEQLLMESFTTIELIKIYTDDLPNPALKSTFNFGKKVQDIVEKVDEILISFEDVIRDHSYYYENEVKNFSLNLEKQLKQVFKRSDPRQKIINQEIDEEKYIEDLNSRLLKEKANNKVNDVDENVNQSDNISFKLVGSLLDEAKNLEDSENELTDEINLRSKSQNYCKEKATFQSNSYSKLYKKNLVNITTDKIVENKEILDDKSIEKNNLKQSFAKADELKKFSINLQENHMLYEEGSKSDRRLRSPGSYHNSPGNLQKKIEYNINSETIRNLSKGTRNIPAYTSYKTMFNGINSTENIEPLNFNKIPSRLDQNKERLSPDNQTKCMSKAASNSKQRTFADRGR